MTEADLLYVVRGAHQKLMAQERYARDVTGAQMPDFVRGIPFYYRRKLEREIKRRLSAPMFAGAALAAMRVGENEHVPIFEGNRLCVDFKQRPGEAWRAEVTLGDVTVTQYLGETPLEAGERVHREAEQSLSHVPDVVTDDGDIDWKVSPPTTEVIGTIDAAPRGCRVTSEPITFVGVNFPQIPPEGVRGELTKPDGSKPDGSKVNVTIHADRRVVEDEPTEALYDGLTRVQCLERMKIYNGVGESKPKRDDYMTPAQWDAARAAWSAELRAKVEASDARARHAVVVDDDRWEVDS